jgi:hypothetical protein
MCDLPSVGQGSRGRMRGVRQAFTLSAILRIGSLCKKMATPRSIPISCCVPLSPVRYSAGHRVFIVVRLTGQVETETGWNFVTGAGWSDASLAAYLVSQCRRVHRRCWPLPWGIVVSVNLKLPSTVTVICSIAAARTGSDCHPRRPWSMSSWVKPKSFKTRVEREVLYKLRPE